MQKYAGRGPRLMPEGVDEALVARWVQVVADGGCDAMVCFVFESNRIEFN